MIWLDAQNGLGDVYCQNWLISRHQTLGSITGHIYPDQLHQFTHRLDGLCGIQLG
jgi:uncharacterized Fe-S radical SAM superfamily protein PflX